MATNGPIHVNLNKSVFYVSTVNMFSLWHISIPNSGRYLPVHMCFFYNVFTFTMYTVIVQRLRIDIFCMSHAVMLLVDGTFSYENIYT